jgi:hypothetical protein
MLLLDDILFAPAKGLMWIFREIHHAAEQEREHEAEQITAELSALYQALETGALSEVDFDMREKLLLDRLDVLQGNDDEEDDEEEDDQDDEDEGDDDQEDDEEEGDDDQEDDEEEDDQDDEEGAGEADTMTGEDDHV